MIHAPRHGPRRSCFFRRSSCRTSLSFTFALLLAGSTLGRALHAQAARRPDILVLLTDDQRWDALGSAGHPKLRTPNIDRLAAQGVSFRNAFVTTAICCVSRACFVTGRYGRRAGVGDFATPLSPEVLATTYPAQLHRAGYRTGCLGKWGIGGPEPRDVFDVWNATGGQGQYFETVNGERVHNSELLARRAIDFLRGCPAEQPFCLLVCYKSPHEPFLPDPIDLPLFKDDTFAPPRTYTEADFARFPEFIRASEGRRRLEQRHPTPGRYQEFVRQYLRCVAGVDRSVGKILGALDETGRTANTVVVFTSDHGFFLGEHGLSGKWLMHEESLRIPWIVQWPGLPAALRGHRLDPMILNIDLAPTLLDLAGIPNPGGMDGRSFKALLEGKPFEGREDFFYEHHFHYGGLIPRTEGIRTRQWKYITYFDTTAPPSGAEPCYEELYDLSCDPFEERNLAAEPRERERLEAMRARREERSRELGPAVLPR